MSTSTSANLGLTLPGATVNDTRLGDMQAVKSALITADAAIANMIASNASVGGNIGIDFSAKNLNLAGDILPSTNSLQNIGSPTKRFKAIYVDEAHLSINTLYLGETAVLGTNADTVNINADPGQSIHIKTTGFGSTLLTSETGVVISSNGADNDVLIQASGIGGQVRFGANQSIELTSTSVNVHGDSTVSGNQTVSGGLTVSGNLVVNGAVTTVNSTTVTTKDNIIEVNKGQVGSGVSAGKAGLSVDRGDEPVYQMVFDETDDMFKVGMVGFLETIASQNYVASFASPVSHIHSAATASVSGFMSALDKIKLDSLINTTDANLITTGTLNVDRLPALPWSLINTKPTTLGGYGITDAVISSQAFLKSYTIATPSQFGDWAVPGISFVSTYVVRMSTSGWQTAKFTDYRTSGKYVFEAYCTVNNQQAVFGFVGALFSCANNYVGSGNGINFGVMSYNNTGTAQLLPSSGVTAYGTIPQGSANNPYMFAVDLDAGKAWVSINNVWANGGNPATGLNPSFTWTPGTALAPAVTPPQSGQYVYVNVGATAFANTVPVGFVSGWGTFNITGAVTNFNNRSGSVTLLNTDITTALGYTPLSTNQTTTFTGDATGSGTTSVALTLANVVTAGTGTKIIYNAKGLVTGNTALVTSDIPALDYSKITTGKPTTLGGYGITDALTTSQINNLYVPKTYILGTPSNFGNSGGITFTTITGNKTRIASNTSGWQSALVTTYKNTGKYVIEVSDITMNGAGTFGFAASDFPISGTSIGNTYTSFSINTQTGNLVSTANITKIGTGLEQSANVPTMIAIDLDAGKAWMCVNNVWANGGNPATGLNPSFTWTPGSLSLAPAGSPNQLGEGGALDFNFGTTSFVNTVPVGFIAGWGTSVLLTNVTNFNNRSGAVTLLNTDVTLALGYTPINSSLIGAVNGIATLGSDGKVLSTQLPSYVDDVIEVATLLAFPVIGETGKIYVALDNNKTYRWSGSTYIFITSGAVDSVAGKTGVITLIKDDVGLSNVDNTSDINKPVSTAQSNAITTAQSNASIDATNKANAAQAASTPIAHASSGGNAHANVVANSTAGFMIGTDKAKLDNITGTNTGDETNVTILGKLGLISISGNNTGDETSISIKSKLGISTLSGANTGDQTLATLGIPNVQNKSSATIRSELTSSDVTTALGYVPASSAGPAVFVIDVDTTAVAGGIYILTAGLALTLPLNPVQNTTISVSNCSNVKTCIINPNGQLIKYVSGNQILDQGNEVFKLVFANATIGWVFVS